MKLQNYRLFTLKEQIFFLFASFLTLMTTLTAITNRGGILWFIITIYTLALTVLTYKNIYINLLYKVGIYTIMFIILPIFWIYNFHNLITNLGLTILSFIFINYLTEYKERIIINVTGILFMQILLFFINKNSSDIMELNKILNLSNWIITLPIIITFIYILQLTIEKSYKIERQHNLIREEKLLDLSIKDHLTGLYNRNYMEQKLKSIHSIWKRGIQTYSLIMVDIDYFKNYNDFYGHIQGDSCLKVISTILQSQLNRDTDYAFRYGGEEFLILLGFTDIKGANKIAEKIKRALEDEKIPHEKSEVSDNLTISMGVGTIDDSFDSFSDLLIRTDKALYNAKKTGRNKIVHYQGE